MSSLLCWNVQGRVTRLGDQLERVIDLGCELICLQEVTPKTAELWRHALAQAGWEHAVATEPSAAVAAGRGRPLLTLTASQEPLDYVPVADTPWPERVLATSVGGLELVNVHSPISPKPGLVKVLTHEAVAAHLAAGSGPRALCGDLNTPRKEHADGRVWTFARDRYGRLRPDRGERWDEAELALIRGLERHGFRDAFRSLHGPEVRELSWEWPRWGGGYRLDHLIVSSDVQVAEVGYLHEWRLEGLSDHSPLHARISWPRPASPPTPSDEVVAGEHVDEGHERHDRGDAPGELRDQAAGL